MTYFIKYTKTQVKKLINENFGAVVKLLPSKANPNSEWFAGVGTEIKSVEELEQFINSVKQYQCNKELGLGVAFWVDESVNQKKDMPKENAIPCWRVQRNGEDGFMYCMIEGFAKYQNTSHKKIQQGVVYTPHDVWTQEDIASGLTNNFYFWDGDYKGMRFIAEGK